MSTGEQFDIFSSASALDALFDRLPGRHGTKEHALAVTQQAKNDCLPVVIIEKSLDREFPFHVTVGDSSYTLNAFNCLQGAEQFIARHQLVLR